MNLVEIHDLKIWPEFFKEVIIGNKNFELRAHDRDFKRGDHVVLREWIPDQEAKFNCKGEVRVSEPVGYTGRKIKAKIGYVLPIWEDKNGTEYVIFSLLEVTV